jgi:hypothetical protein
MPQWLFVLVAVTVLGTVVPVRAQPAAPADRLALVAYLVGHSRTRLSRVR